MERFLALSSRDRNQAFAQVATARGLQSTSIEKDFWVTLALRELFAIEGLAEHLTFKGGTSLSKAWHLIDRFSEDVDLTLARELLDLGSAGDPETATSNSERRRRVERVIAASETYVAGPLSRALDARLRSIIPSDEEWSLRQDAEETQTLLFHYPRRRARTEPAYLAPAVRLEFGARSDPWPVERRIIRPLVADESPSLFDRPDVDVRALSPVRTFWEKAMLLHEETFRPADRPQRRRLSRHYYDLARLIDAGVGRDAAQDTTLFARVAAHRELYFRQTWVDYTTLAPGTLCLAPAPAREPEWRRDYDAMRGEMLAGDPPTFDDILMAVRRFEHEFNAASGDQA